MRHRSVHHITTGGMQTPFGLPVDPDVEDEHWISTFISSLGSLLKQCSWRLHTKRRALNPVNRTASTFNRHCFAVWAAFQAASVFDFSGIGRPPRTPHQR